MNNVSTQPDLLSPSEEMKGSIFELYEKTQHREFKSHVQFIRATSIQEAEDLMSEMDPEYWRTRSIRSVDHDYTWEMLEQLHFSYRMCKSALGLEGIFED